MCVCVCLFFLIFMVMTFYYMHYFKWCIMHYAYSVCVRARVYVSFVQFVRIVDVGKYTKAKRKMNILIQAPWKLELIIVSQFKIYIYIIYIYRKNRGKKIFLEICIRNNFNFSTVKSLERREDAELKSCTCITTVFSTLLNSQN